MPSIQLATDAAEARKAIAAGLDAFNARHFPEMHPETFALTLSEGGAVVGGVAAEVMSGWMLISLLWVDERFRKQGFGAKLLTEAEAEGGRRGVQGVLVDSFSFQAPGFYEHYGYVVYGQVDGFPAAGMTWVRLRKTL